VQFPDDQKNRINSTEERANAELEAAARSNRAKKAREIFRSRNIEKSRERNTYHVEGSKGEIYTVDLRHGAGTCTCPYWKKYARGCKHIDAVRIFLAEGPRKQAPSITALIRKVRPRYPQGPAYHAARKASEELIPLMLRALCSASSSTKAAHSRHPK
jgi:uncharacterized Zn finger protein